MSFVKELLTKESFKISDFTISTFAVVISVIFIILLIYLKIKRRPLNFTNGIKMGFITLSIITFLFAFLNFFTGEFLFSNKDNFRLYMFIALIAIFMYIKNSFKELFKKREEFS